MSDKETVAGMIAGLGSGIILVAVISGKLWILGFGIPVALFGFLWGYRLKVLWPSQKKEPESETKPIG